VGNCSKINTDQVKVRYPHAQHGLAQKPINLEKRSIREDFLLFVDESSHPNGRNAGSARAQYYFSPKFTPSQRKTVTRKQVIPFFVSSIGLKKSRIKRDALNVQLFGG